MRLVHEERQASYRGFGSWRVGLMRDRIEVCMNDCPRTVSNKTMSMCRATRDLDEDAK